MDDLSPQVLAHTAQLALERGALDVMSSAVTMKKGRLGTLLTVLCKPGDAADLQQLIFRETTTLGIRVREENRVILARESTPVETDFGVIHIKTGSWQGEEWNAAPEFEDCRRAAAAFDVPLKTVMQAAMNAWRTRQPAGSAVMTGETILAMLQCVRDGELRPEEAMERLANLPYEETGFAKIDHHRPLRTGLPEVIYAAGKTAAQVGEIFFRMAAMGGDVLATRADEAAFAAVKALVPEAQYHPVARIVALQPNIAAREKRRRSLAVLCAGTSDLPVAEEAAVTAEVMGAEVRRIYDVGVAGLHRLLAHREGLREAEVVIVCAGMEGALPSVVGGMVGAPVIAVPTSVGYGASFGGIAALLGMLNSCSPNVTVVNIDNGFGAAYVASTILRRIHQAAGKNTAQEMMR